MDAKKVGTLLKKIDVSLDQWKLQVLSGKRILSDLVASIYPTDVRVLEELTIELDETKLQVLKSCLKQLESISKDVQKSNLKFKALQELQSMSTPTASNNSPADSLLEVNGVNLDLQDLLSWVNSIAAEVKEQYEMNCVVVENICHLESRDQALFHQGVWVLQPAISNETELHMSCIRHVVSSQEKT
eukprot:TRINITY_DN11174_c0_g1_i1.p1 TRINITY_DN11174_c0_g1~~TRINITY_DN11174_c0_g1_i1.p1  ORF type:complete len:187 (+),score=23.57 TRINITY_DN11174_c0_g1_i1:32-592(+)